MKTAITVLTIGAGAIGGLLATANRNNEGLDSRITVDPTPPLRSGALGGYADVVDAVAPSVVGIFTTREATVSGRGAQVPGQLFESPMFREFFGPGFRGQGGGSPRQMPPQQGLGSGVILTADGYVLTNNHVVENADEIKVQLSDGEEHAAEIVATDPASDVAVIKVEGDDFPAATIGSSDGLKPGDAVLAIGSPFGLSHTVTSGIVSAVGRNNLNITGYDNFIQTDASINPGNSGGALIDNKGRVVGINTAIFSRSGGNVGIGFAIPIDMVVKIADQLISNGGITRGYLGVSLAPLTDELAEALEVEQDQGVVVNQVMPNTPAESAGFEAGDVIVSCGGETVRSAGDLRLQVAGNAPGAELIFGVRRGDKKLELKAVIAELPENLMTANASPGSPGVSPERGALKGVRLGSLDIETRRQLELGADVEGAVVLAIDPGSDAAAAGLRPGNVITEVNRSAVTGPSDAYAKAAERKDRATLLRVTDGKLPRYMAIG